MPHNHPDIALLERLQEFDRERMTLETEIAGLAPKIHELEKHLASTSKKLEANTAALTANDRERRKLEGDVQLHQGKMAKLKKQQADVMIPSQYQAMEKEIQWCVDEIAKAEERELELMVEAETLTEQAKELTTGVAEEKAHLAKFIQAALKQRDEGRARLAVVAAQHGEVAAQVTPTNKSLYDRLRKKHPKGPICVEVANNICEGCKMTMRLAIWQELRANRPFLTCESCGRVIYYLEQEEIIEG